MNSRSILAAVAAAAALAVVPGAASAQAPLPACDNTFSNAVQVTGQGDGSGDIDCSYTAFGRGGVEAATTNEWQVFVNRDGQKVVLACSDDRPECADHPSAPRGLPVQSVESFEGETVMVTMFAGPSPTGSGATGTYGTMRVGGAGLVSCDPSGPIGCAP